MFCVCAIVVEEDRLLSAIYRYKNIAQENLNSLLSMVHATTD